ncbi:hypothetical protein [Lichenifustis flavocetrariae]|uniref:Glycosyltransferase RgtA/B/C/D-like domain-containing protein n=1 Tax=Lichenifustis flavocetrariae TaxID=2949735 RepID=A0AA42CIG2_9HYPH|nr:hypothetical protein [Lichenifustis flavocetrariae]MCW6506826.1 hypothetical protein [Lichenifustis flavocetrariae]
MLRTAPPSGALASASPQGRSTSHFGWMTRRRAAVAVALLVGLVLRIAAATGDLGLDEAWSLKLVTGLHSFGDVFWGLPHDNNHPLNSAWLFLIGAGRPVWLYRMPAIVFGTLTIAAVARCLGRRSEVAGIIGAWFAAVALPLVDFGSEARGYAGLTLASVLAIDAWDRVVAAPPWSRPSLYRRARRDLGLAIGFGALSHLGMMLTVSVLGAATLIHMGASTRRVVTTLVGATRLFLPCCLYLLPALTALAIGIDRGGGYKIGDIDPFSAAKLAQGLGGMLTMITGLPDTIPPAVAITATLAVVATAAVRRILAPHWTTLSLSTFVILPCVILAAQPPNVGYARYFAVCGLVLLMIEAAALGHLWVCSENGRRWAVAGSVAIVTGGLTLDSLQIGWGRSAASATLALMNAEGDETYTASRPKMAALLLDAAAGRTMAGVPLSAAAFCPNPPEWYIAVGLYDPMPDAPLAVGPEQCRTTYRARRPFASSPLSGTQWTLYRRP